MTRILILLLAISVNINATTLPINANKRQSKPLAKDTSVFLNIKDFGAIGDGKTDDTSALLKAIKKAQETEGTVYFPHGNYAIHPIKVPSHITLLGYSAWSYENKGNKDKDFKGKTTISALSGDARALLDLDDSRGTRILGLTLDGKNLGKAMHGVYARNRASEQYICIEDCRINYFTGSGIKLERSWVFSIRKCLIMFNGQHGIDATGGYDGWIIDCQLTANKLNGLYAKGSPPDDMPQSEIDAIRFFGTASIMFTANRVEWNKTGGIVLNGSNSMQITGCSIDHNFGPGLVLNNSTSNTVTGNIFRSNGVERENDGDQCSQIIVKNSKGTTVTGNSLWGWFGRKEAKFSAPYPYYGIIIKDLEGCVVSQNAMYHSSSKEGVLDYGGHISSIITQNAYVKPNIKMTDNGWTLEDRKTETNQTNKDKN